MAETSSRILRRREVEALVGLTRSTIYGMMSAGKFPRPRRLGRRSVGWLSDDIAAWLESRPVADPRDTAA